MSVLFYFYGDNFERGLIQNKFRISLPQRQGTAVSLETKCFSRLFFVCLIASSFSKILNIQLVQHIFTQ